MAFTIRNRSGLTLVELIVAFAILMILSTMALPLARIKVQREKERLLRERLSEIRKAVDRFKDAADVGRLGRLDPDNHGYPESLELLVEGVSVQGGMGMETGLGPGMQGQAGRPIGRRLRRPTARGSVWRPTKRRRLRKFIERNGRFARRLQEPLGQRRRRYRGDG